MLVKYPFFADSWLNFKTNTILMVNARNAILVHINNHRIKIREMHYNKVLRNRGKRCSYTLMILRTYIVNFEKRKSSLDENKNLWNLVQDRKQEKASFRIRLILILIRILLWIRPKIEKIPTFFFWLPKMIVMLFYKPIILYCSHITYT